jgi:lysophospholipase L1-like esterase
MTRQVPLILLLLTFTACAQNQSPTQPTPVPTTGVDYSAIGASDAIGYGGSVPCFPFTACPDGTGYVPVLVRRLQAAGKTVTLLNLGIPGSVLSAEIEALGNSLGRHIPSNFINDEAPFVLRTSTLVTVFAGGNDANTIGAAVKAGLGGDDPTSYVQVLTQDFGRDLVALVGAIRSRAPTARIVILNLPNLAALPYAAGDSPADQRELQLIAVGLSAQVNALTKQGALVIDLMCDSRFYQASIFSSDGFHPNDTGYAYLADLVYAAATTGFAATPQSSCSEMTLF